MIEIGITKKQHYVSQGILKHFADQQKKIYELFIDKSIVTKKSIVDTMSQNYVYEHSKIEKNSIEDLFAKFESKAFPLIDSLITEIEEYCRDGDNIIPFKDKIDSIIPYVLLFYFRSGALLREYSMDAENPKEVRVERMLLNIMDVGYIRGLRNTICNCYKCAIICDEEEKLLLSDQYVSTVALKYKNRFSNASNRQIGMKDTMILIPLSSKFYIVFFYGRCPVYIKENKFVKLDEKEVQEINDVIYQNSYVKCVGKTEDELERVKNVHFETFSPTKCINSSIKCSTCGCETNVDDMDFIVEDYFDSLLQKKLKRKKRIPAWVYGSTAGKNWDRAANKDDILIEKELENDSYGGDIKSIQWGELHRRGYHYGIDYLHQFYTCRNYFVMNTLWKMTEAYDEKMRDALKLLLLSYNASNCTMMTRVVAKKNSKDFVLTGAQSGVLYISRLPVEKNILLGLKRKAKPIGEAYKLLEKCTGTYIVHNSSSRKLVEENESVDFVFTDPPFGDFIPYAEVNQINELWLEKATDRSEEIIISESQKKSLTEYQTMLTDVFCEICRVLKPDGYATVVFHAAKAKVWEAFKGVIDESGLNVRLTNILDKKQASFKQVVSEDSVQGDPLILLEKNMVRAQKLDKDGDWLKEICNRVSDENGDERRIYSLYVNECLSRNVEVKYDAKKAYEIIRRLRKV